MAYRLGRRVLSVIGTVARSDGALIAEILALRHENAVLRRQVARVRYEPADRTWFAALSALVPRAQSAGPTVDQTCGQSPDPADGAGQSVLGHRRIQGELAKLGHRIAYATVWQILTDEGVDPAPRRTGPTWTRFLATQARTIIATDFFHVDTVLLKRVYVLVFIEHGTRRMHLSGVTATPDGVWAAQQARSLAMGMGARLSRCACSSATAVASSPGSSTPCSRTAGCGSSSPRRRRPGRTRSAGA
jgi:hypothetical protein